MIMMTKNDGQEDLTISVNVTDSSCHIASKFSAKNPEKTDSRSEATSKFDKCT